MPLDPKSNIVQLAFNVLVEIAQNKDVAPSIRIDAAATILSKVDANPEDMIQKQWRDRNKAS
jgi:hypothetical protein